jgi:hypothetical protein
VLDGIDRRPTHLRVRVDDRQSYVLCECFIRLLYVGSLQRSAACSFKYFRNAASNIIFFIMVMRVHMRVRPLPNVGGKGVTRGRSFGRRPARGVASDTL